MIAVRLPNCLFLLLLLALAGLSPAQEIPKYVPAAKPWKAEWGSHRVLVRVAEAAEAVQVHIPWRRRDLNPEKKGVVVVALKSNQPVAEAAVFNVTAESGDVVFSPSEGAGDYAIHFLPVKLEGGNFPRLKYTPPAQTAFQTAAAGKANLPKATIVGWEAITAQDAFTEMEIIATEAETKAVRAAFAGSPFNIYLEDREHVIRMFDRLPYRWTLMNGEKVPDDAARRAPLLQNGPNVVLAARPGETCVFQVAVWAPEQALVKAVPEFDAFKMKDGGGIPAEAITCYNTTGVDWNGRPMALSVEVPAGRIQPLWCSVKVPAEARAGRYTGEVKVRGNGHEVSRKIDLEISGAPVADRGESNPQSLAKLDWLNSKIGIANEPTRGYAPVEVKGRVLRVLGREIELGDDGLPQRITSFFNAAVTKIGEQRLELLAAPMQFRVLSADFPRELTVTAEAFKITEQTPGAVTWTSAFSGVAVEVKLEGRLEFDGSLHYRTTVSGKGAVKDIALEILRPSATVPYIIGMGQEAGEMKPFEWRWDVAKKNQDSVWMGAVNGGLRLQLRAENYVRPGVNIHYERRPLNAPPSWWNEGRGGVSVAPVPNTAPGSPVYALRAFSGERTLGAEALHFDFDLLVTPFHPLHTKEQWSDRYFHNGGTPPNLAKANLGPVNVINIHQGNALNPYINYPFLTADKLREYAETAHARGLRTKYYYTVRELSNWAPELFAFRSLGNEVLLQGKGGGHPWLEEHLGGDYWQAWYEGRARDVSLLTAPMSRLHNFYLEGMRWLVENAGCDGIYLDDIAYDRAIMLRARRVLDQYCPRPALIDLHSWNEFHAGGAFAQCMNLFMDSLPFVDRVWFGEGHHYSGPPAEHFLVEISGVPFGLLGEMLEGGGNPWLGLVHGEVGRLGWGGNPAPIWKLWDDFGAADAEFIGWWAGKENPVQVSEPQVKATIWKKAGRTLIALGNFDRKPQRVKLTIDWAALGLSPAKAKLYAPILQGLQMREGIFAPDAAVTVSGLGGVVFYLDETERQLEVAKATTDVVTREETFATLPAEKDGWTAAISQKVPAANLRADHGLVLQMPAHLHAWYEKKLPAGCTGVAASVWQDGQDEGQQWGPGLALVWENAATLKVNYRQDGRIAVTLNGQESFPATVRERADLQLGVRWDRDEVRVIAGGPAMQDLDEVVAAIPRAKFPGNPAAVRLGKMPANAGTGDHVEPGTVGFNRFAWLRFYGPAGGGAAPNLPAGKAPEVKPAPAAGDAKAAASSVVKKSVWEGYERLDFTVGGRTALLIVPKIAAPGKPWIWRTEFFGHEPQGDIALLGQGYHVAAINTVDLYGAPVALDAMDKFYAHLRENYGLAEKVVLEGFSRGGLYAFNWGARHPEWTAAIYGDAPVCDFKSWPGGKGAAFRRDKEWAECLKAYGLTEEQALAYKLNPVDNLAPLAKAKVPILCVCGDADPVVPIAENARLVEARYKALGGTIEMIVKPGVEHHPHSLKDPKPIVDFVLKHQAAAK